MKELKKESPDTKMIFSIGGFNHPDEPFSILVSNKTLRQAFIKNSIQFLRNSSFDGLDLFWYSPVYWNNDVKDHVEDKQNFLDFVKELHFAFKKYNLLLMTEVSGLKEVMSVAFDLEIFSQHVDFINIVSWDLAGYWNSLTGYGNSVQNMAAKNHCYAIVRFANISFSAGSVTRLGDLLDYGQIFKAFGNN